jgi:hypothetical protein
VTEVDKIEHEFTTSVASVYRLLTSKIIVSESKNGLPGLDRLLKHKMKLRKLWQ